MNQSISKIDQGIRGYVGSPEILQQRQPSPRWIRQWREADVSSTLEMPSRSQLCSLQLIGPCRASCTCLKLTIPGSGTWNGEHRAELQGASEGDYLHDCQEGPRISTTGHSHFTLAVTLWPPKHNTLLPYLMTNQQKGTRSLGLTVQIMLLLYHTMSRKAGRSVTHLQWHHEVLKAGTQLLPYHQNHQHTQFSFFPSRSNSPPCFWPNGAASHLPIPLSLTPTPTIPFISSPEMSPSPPRS